MRKAAERKINEGTASPSECFVGTPVDKFEFMKERLELLFSPMEIMVIEKAYTFVEPEGKEERLESKLAAIISKKKQKIRVASTIGSKLNTSTLSFPYVPNKTDLISVNLIILQK